MLNTRRKHTKEFKAKVVLEALKERETLEHLAKKFELTWEFIDHPTGL
jgi:transposase-like protein